GDLISQELIYQGGQCRSMGCLCFNSNKQWRPDDLSRNGGSRKAMAIRQRQHNETFRDAFSRLPVANDGIRLGYPVSSAEIRQNRVASGQDQVSCRVDCGPGLLELARNTCAALLHQWCELFMP